MKYAIVIPDGCADEPQAALGGKTPLQAANTPHMDAIAAAGVVGRANHVPAHLPPGSDVANLSLLGYDPEAHFTGRAPLEAAAQGVQLAPEDWAIRCNLVTVEGQVMKSFTAGHISSAEAAQLLQTAQTALGSGPLEFVPGVVTAICCSIAARTRPHRSRLKPARRHLTISPISRSWMIFPVARAAIC